MQRRQKTPPWATLFIAIVLLFFRFPAQGDDRLESPWKANFIYQCALYFKWPPSREDGSQLIIGTSGNDDVHQILMRDLHGKTVNHKTVSVIRASPGDITKCHIIYVGTKTRSPASFLNQAKGRAVVTIGETSDGFMVQFTPVKQTLSAKGDKRLIESEGLNCTAALGKILYK
jgi:hypothetical protein